VETPVGIGVLKKKKRRKCAEDRRSTEPSAYKEGDSRTKNKAYRGRRRGVLNTPVKIQFGRKCAGGDRSEGVRKGTGNPDPMLEKSP